MWSQPARPDWCVMRVNTGRYWLRLNWVLIDGDIHADYMQHPESCSCAEEVVLSLNNQQSTGVCIIPPWPTFLLRPGRPL